MRKIVLTCCLLLTGITQAADYLVPKYVSMELHQIDKMNDPYLYPRDKELKYGGVFNTDFNLIESGRWSLIANNRVSFEQSQVTGKVISGGWKFFLGGGYSIADHQSIEIGKYHHSYHIFEDTRERHFPTRDDYMINLIIYQK